MTKFKINLQLFAEDEVQDDEQKGENKESETNHENEEVVDDEKKYTDKDIDKIINKKFAEWEKKKTKEIDEAKKLAEMNATERAEYERDQLKQQLAELQRKDTMANMANTARSMLAEKNISVSDNIVSMLISDDAEKTKTAIEEFATSFNKAVQEAVKEALKGNAPKVGGNPKLSKDDIMKITNRDERQRLIKENMDLFMK